MSATTPRKSSSSMESSKNAIKCRRCRKNLLELSPGMLSDDVESCCEFVQQIFSVASNTEEASAEAEIDYPSWIVDQFDQAGWIRGKLLCPYCSAKVGAFNFVGGSRCQCRRSLVPSVYFVLAHVDAPATMSTAVSQPNLGTDFVSESSTSDTAVNQACESNQRLNENVEPQPESSNSASTYIGYALMQNSELMDIDSLYYTNSDRRRDKMDRLESKLRSAIRRTRLGRVNRRVARIVKTVGYRVHETGDDASVGVHNEDKPDDSGLDMEVDADAQCAICLDVYCMPRRCVPCGHSFCGWCLRSLAHATSPYDFEGYLCPLCRAKIVWTEDDKANQQDVKARYPSLVKQRLTAYRKQRRRHRWALPEGTKWEQFLLAASMRIPRRLCACFAVVLLALFLYFNWFVVQEYGNSLLIHFRNNSDAVSALFWISAVTFCFLLAFSA